MNEHKESRYLDIDEMVDELQNKYREYSRRKRIAFKSCVLKGMNKFCIFINCIMIFFL